MTVSDSTGGTVGVGVAFGVVTDGPGDADGVSCLTELNAVGGSMIPKSV